MTFSIRAHLPAVLVLGCGIALFLVLAVTPVFPQLVSRGSDFLMPVGEVVQGRWRETIPSIPTHLGYFVQYVGWGSFILSLIAVFLPGRRRLAITLLLSFVVFCLPVWLLGRMVYPRYLFPAALYLTLLAAVGAESLWRWTFSKAHTASRRLAGQLLLSTLLLQIVITGVRFIIPSFWNSSQTPFVAADQTQYLTSWSSGHGIAETFAYLQIESMRNPSQVLHVATEGNFGSLPDGLLMNNDRSPLPNVRIDGIGYPVETIPESFSEGIHPGDAVYLIINSDRLNWPLDRDTVLLETCRPHGASCLQLWDITHVYPLFQR